MPSLNGKTAMVLGGSRGIGAAIVRRLVKDGAKVSFTFHQSIDAATDLAASTGAASVCADSADRQATSKAISAQGSLDILVVNAGFGVGGDPLEQDPDLVDRMIDVNIRGPYHAAVEGARRMHKGGRIVIMGSVNGDRVPFPRAAAYAMTKSAVQGMVRGLARDFGDREITVNCVQPGPVDTDSNPADGQKAGDMHAVMALKRHARPEEIAGLVSYLVGPEATFVTGALHTIDGGFSA